MERPNVIIIVMDTMRLDAFSNIESRFKSFEKLGLDSLNNCIAPSSWTLPSHASLFTGMYPSEHGSHETTKIKSLDIEHISLKVPTFIKDLNAIGYSSYGISANPYVHPVYGFKDFSFFHEESYFTDIFGSVVEVSEKVKPRILKYRNAYGNDIIKLSHAMLKEDPNLFFEAAGSALTLTPKAFLKKARAKLIDGWPIEKGGKNSVKLVKGMDFKKQYFLFVNLMEAHDPYIGKKGMDMNWSTPFQKKPVEEKLIEQWKRLYDGASLKAYRYAAEIVKSMIDRYGDDQLIIVTSDHGQEFNEHGFIGHGTMLHDEMIKIPFAVKLPYKSKPINENGYSSLVGIKNLVLDVISSKAGALERFSSGKAKAESFGIPANISMKDSIDPAKIKAHEKEIVRILK